MNKLKNKKYFFGWTNIKWVIAELGKTWSKEDSYFSSKKIERFLLFISGVYVLLRWYSTHVEKIEYEEAIAISATFLGYAGFTMIQTQKEKRIKKLKKDEEAID